MVLESALGIPAAITTKEKVSPVQSRSRVVWHLLKHYREQDGVFPAEFKTVLNAYSGHTYGSDAARAILGLAPGDSLPSDIHVVNIEKNKRRISIDPPDKNEQIIQQDIMKGIPPVNGRLYDLVLLLNPEFEEEGLFFRRDLEKQAERLIAHIAQVTAADATVFATFAKDSFRTVERDAFDLALEVCNARFQKQGFKFETILDELGPFPNPINEDHTALLDHNILVLRKVPSEVPLTQ